MAIDILSTQHHVYKAKHFPCSYARRQLLFELLYIFERLSANFTTGNSEMKFRPKGLKNPHSRGREENLLYGSISQGYMI